MDLFFEDPSVIPLPPKEVRIREVSVKPYPDGKRVRVRVVIDPFQKRPSLEVIILDAFNEPAAQTRFIELMGCVSEMTMHLREDHPDGVYTIQVFLYYQDVPSMQEDETVIEYPSPQIVDEQQHLFTLTSAHGSNPVTETT